MLPSLAEFEAQFVDYASGNFSLASTSAWKNAAPTDWNLGVRSGRHGRSSAARRRPPPAASGCSANVAPSVSGATDRSERHQARVIGEYRRLRQ
jgi:hypothetical protein